MDALRHRLAPDEALTVALAGGGFVFLEAAGTLGLWLVNGSGPFDQRQGPGTAIALLGGSAVGGLVLSLLLLVSRRSTAALVGLVVLLGTAMWVLLPRHVDVSESWVARPNPRWSCTGLSFSHYPVATMDASSIRWCVGLEHRISDG